MIQRKQTWALRQQALPKAGGVIWLLTVNATLMEILKLDAVSDRTFTRVILSLSALSRFCRLRARDSTDSSGRQSASAVVNPICRTASHCKRAISRLPQRVSNATAWPIFGNGAGACVNSQTLRRRLIREF